MSMFKLLASAGLTVALTGPVLSKDFEAANIPSDFGRLVPEGAWAVVYTPSLNHLVQEITPLASAIEPAAAQQLAMMPMMMSMIATEGGPAGGRPAKPATFHLDKPMGIAVGPTNHETGEPEFTMILSAVNAGDIRLAGGAMGAGPTEVVHLEGTDWVALTSKKFTPGSRANALCDGLFESDLSVVFDQKAVVRDYGPMIEAAMAAMSLDMPVPPDATAEQKEQMASLKKMQEYNAKQLRMLLDGFKQWDIGIDLDGTKLDLLTQYTLTEHSIIPHIAGGTHGSRSGPQPLMTLARLVPDDMSVQFLLNKSSVDAMMRLSEAQQAAGDDLYSPETRAKLSALIPIWNESIADLSTGVSGAMSFPSSGIKLMQFLDTHNSGKMLKAVDEAWTALSKADLGFTAQPLHDGPSGGVGFDIKIDPAKLFGSFGGAALMGMPGMDNEQMSEHMSAMIHKVLGGDSLPIMYASSGRMVVVGAGNDQGITSEALARVKARSNKSTRLSAALGKAWAAPTWAVTLEMRSLLGEMMDLVKAMAGPARVMLPPSIPAGSPVPLQLVGSATETASQVRVMTDIADWLKFIKEVMAAAEAHSRSNKAA